MPEQFSKEEQEKIGLIRNEIEAAVKTQVEAGKMEATEALNKVNELVDKVESTLADLKAKQGAVHLGMDKKDRDKFSFAKVAYALARKDWSKAGFENEVLTETMKNAQTSGTASEGGVMVPTDLSNDLIEMLKAESVLIKMGAQVLNVSGAGQVDFPRQTGASTAYWLGELDTITESALAFDSISLSPKKVAAMVRMSRELMADANQSIEAIVRRDMAEQLALALDLKGLFGDGTSNTPVGILNTANILTLSGTDGDPANFQTVDALIGLMEDENSLRGNLGLVSNPKVFRAIRNQTVAQYTGQTEGAPIFNPIMSDAQLEGVLGYKFGKTTQIPTNGTKGTGTDLSTLILGNFNDLILAQWGGMEIDGSDVAGDNFARYSVQLRAIMRADWGVRQPKSFAVATDIETTAAINA